MHHFNENQVSNLQRDEANNAAKIFHHAISTFHVLKIFLSGSGKIKNVSRVKSKTWLSSPN